MGNRFLFQIKIWKHGYNLSASFCYKGKAKKEVKIVLETRMIWILITKNSPLDKRELRDADMFQFVVIPAGFLVYYFLTWENNDIANRRLQTKSFSGVSFNFIHRIEVDVLSVGVLILSQAP